jgi:hypothetical protein
MVRLPSLLLLAVSLNGQPTLPSAPDAPANLPDAPVVTPQSPVDLDKPADKRILGVLPNYRTSNPYSVYKPMTAEQKMTIAAKDSFDYPIYLLGGFFAGLDQIGNSDPSYGQGTKGFAKRYAANNGDLMLGNLMTEGIMPSLLHQDPRYFRLAQGSIKKRTWYALSQTFVTRDDNGKRDFNYSEWIGNSAAVAIGQSYHFDDRNAAAATGKLFQQCAVDAVSQVVKEFWPDVKRKFFKPRKRREPATEDVNHR